MVKIFDDTFSCFDTVSQPDEMLYDTAAMGQRRRVELIDHYCVSRCVFRTTL